MADKGGGCVIVTDAVDTQLTKSGNRNLYKPLLLAQLPHSITPTWCLPQVYGGVPPEVKWWQHQHCLHCMNFGGSSCNSKSTQREVFCNFLTLVLHFVALENTSEWNKNIATETSNTFW